MPELNVNWLIDLFNQFTAHCIHIHLVVVDRLSYRSVVTVSYYLYFCK